MALSPTDFAWRVSALRPTLLSQARRAGKCNADAAEDLVGEAILLGLERLNGFDESTGTDGLRRWLSCFVHYVILDKRQTDARSVPTVPLEAAANVAAPTPISYRNHLRDRILMLPQKYQDVAFLFFDEYNLTEIAQFLGMHRNTVANHVARIHEMFRMPSPDDCDDMCPKLLNFCSKQFVYHKAKSPWRSWKNHHPPEISRARLRELGIEDEMGDEEDVELYDLQMQDMQDDEDYDLEEAA